MSRLLKKIYKPPLIPLLFNNRLVFNNFNTVHKILKMVANKGHTVTNIETDSGSDSETSNDSYYECENTTDFYDTNLTTNQLPNYDQTSNTQNYPYHTYDIDATQNSTNERAINYNTDS